MSSSTRKRRRARRISSWSRCRVRTANPC
jgi:hypothetical protein